MFGIARNFFEVVVPQKNKSGISSSIDCLTSMLGTAMASSVLPLFLLALGVFSIAGFFLQGLAQEEVRTDWLLRVDPAYPMVVTLRAVKPAA